MDFRLFVGLFLSAAGTLLPAQQGQGGQGNAPATTQDRDRPQKSPAEQITELTNQRDLLLKEIQFTQDRVATSKQLLIEKLAARKLTVRAIDAGTSAAAPAAYNPTQRQARLLSAEESQKLGADALMTVNGRVVRQAQLDGMLNYLQTFQASGDQAARTQRAMLELVRIECTVSAFPEGVADAEKQIDEARKELAAGKPFGEVARKYSRGPNLQEDGKLKITRNCPFGLPVEMAAFATSEGQVTVPVRGYTGYVLVQVDKATKGANPDGKANPNLDTVDGRMILVPYHPDPAEIDQARNKAVMGPIDIAVRDDAVMEMLPVLYRPVPGPGPKKDEDGKKSNGAGDAKKAEPAKSDAGQAPPKADPPKSGGAAPAGENHTTGRG